MTSYIATVKRSVLDPSLIDNHRPWSVDRFASRNPVLRGLDEGGSLFLVTISKLRFVTLRAILDAPTFHDGVWVAAEKSAVPPRYVHVNTMSFLAPDGWPRIKTILRKPQPLTGADELVLRAGVPRGVNASTFSVTSSFRPRTISGLKPIQKKQLRVAGRGHDGKNLPAEARLAPRVDPNAMDPNESFDGYLEIVGVSDEHNKLVYDVFICTPDSGSVFKAGTTRVVAELIQGGIQCRNAVLSERLRRALAARRKPTAKRR